MKNMMLGFLSFVFAACTPEVHIHGNESDAMVNTTVIVINNPPPSDLPHTVDPRGDAGTADEADAVIDGGNIIDPQPELDPRGDEDQDGTENRFDCRPLDPDYGLVEFCNDGLDNNCDNLTDFEDIVRCPQLVECQTDQDCLGRPLPNSVCEHNIDHFNSVEYRYDRCDRGICTYIRAQTDCNHGCAGGECLMPANPECQENADCNGELELCWQGECLIEYDPDTEYKIEVRWDDSFSYQCQADRPACSDIPLTVPDNFDHSRIELNCVGENGTIYSSQATFDGRLPSPQSILTSYIPRDPSLVGCFYGLNVYCEANDITPCWYAIQVFVDPMGQMISWLQYGDFYFSIDDAEEQKMTHLNYLTAEILQWWIPFN